LIDLLAKLVTILKILYYEYVPVFVIAVNNHEFDEIQKMDNSVSTSHNLTRQVTRFQKNLKHVVVNMSLPDKETEKQM